TPPTSRNERNYFFTLDHYSTPNV
ncbi:hypothetical protein D047_3675B, partial [Vibrio parahaemolyticus VPTS-2010_2]